MRLLLVEDEPFIALDLESIAAAAGHEIVGVAESLESAVQIASSTGPQAALVDLNLRDGLTGPEVARQLTRHGVQVGFVTGNAEQLQADFAGALGVLEKPFSDGGVLELLNLLQAAMHGRLQVDKVRFVRLAPTLAADPTPPG